MSREIKFRALYKPFGRLITSENVESINFDTKVLGIYTTIDNKGFHKLRLSDFELMQYTGIKDRNGIEIYDGDFIKCTNDADEISELNSDTGIGVVEWLDSEGFWNVAKMENSLADLKHQGYIEVVGNIHENGELLSVPND